LKDLTFDADVTIVNRPGYYYNGELFESGLYPYKESIEIKAKWIPDTYKIIIKDKSGCS
jgi:hypothetical protein